MNRTPPRTAEAIRAAVNLHRRPDGTFHRDGLRELAHAYNVSERTVRRLAADVPMPSTVPQREADPTSVDAARQTAAAGCSRQSLLLSLTVGAGNMKVAHQYAQRTFGYRKVYRSFIRDVERLDPTLVSAARHGYKGLVEDRIYLTNAIPHRNHTWFIDHTMADIEVLPDRGTTPFRPWLTVIVDGATGMYMAIEAWEGHLNTERFTAAITRAAVGEAVNRGEQPVVGGLPNVLVCDNAKEHLAHAVEEGSVRLGIVVSPTTPYHSWENGRVERAHGAIAESFLSTLPGYKKGGVQADGTPRFAPRAGRKDNPASQDRYPTPLLKMSQFQALLEEWRVARNATVKDSKGLTSMDKWLADPTPLLHIDHDLMLANLTVTARPHTVHKSGIRFKNRDYICTELAPYRKKLVNVRYLASVTDWIEVFDGTTYIGRAWLADHLSDVERSRILLNRARVEKQYRKVEQQARQHRTHLAHAINEGWDPEDLPDAPPLADAVDPDGPDASEPLPVLRSTRKHPWGPKAPEPARDDLADRLIGDGFTLEGGAS